MTVQVHGDPFGQRLEVLDRVEGGRQQGVVDGVGRRGHRRDRNAGAVGQLGAFQAAFAPVDRAAPGALPAARGLGGAAVHGQVGQVQADHLVVGVQARQPQPIPHAQPNPLIAAPAQRRRRAARLGDPLVAGAEDQRLHELVEDHRIIDARPVAAQRMNDMPDRQQGQKLLA